MCLVSSEPLHPCDGQDLRGPLTQQRRRRFIFGFCGVACGPDYLKKIKWNHPELVEMTFWVNWMNMILHPFICCWLLTHCRMHTIGLISLGVWISLGGWRGITVFTILRAATLGMKQPINWRHCFAFIFLLPNASDDCRGSFDGGGFAMRFLEGCEFGL